MSPATGTALLLLTVFVLPGFVTLTLRERSHVLREADTAFERLLQALYYSVLIYGLLLVAAWGLGLQKDDLVDFYGGGKSLGENIGAALLIALVLPTAIAHASLQWSNSRELRPRILQRLGISPAHRVQSGWNAMFGREGAAMVRVFLTDGTIVGGYYGVGSMAGYSEHDQDLFIVERWGLDEDGWFGQPAAGSLGLWVPKESIARVELYELSAEPAQPVSR